MEKNLNSAHWQLKGYWAYVPLVKKSMETGIEEMGVTNWFEASVPGSIHNDLYNANIIQDPYFENNSMLCEWIENRWWEYKTVISDFEKSERTFLVFQGIDYHSHIYVNGIKVCENEGAFKPISCEITDLIKEQEQIFINVLIENAPNEMPQMGFSSRVKTAKSRFGYKWDFCPRLVNLGIWDDVLLKHSGKLTIEQMLIKTDIDGKVSINGLIDGATDENSEIKFELFFNKTLINSKTIKAENSFSTQLIMENIQLWYPNGYGEQPLYEVVATLNDNGKISDEKIDHFGFCEARFIENEKAPQDALGYTLLLNGRKTYIKGVNLTPFDIMIGKVTKKDYEDYIALIKNANINLVRIWGGGIIEKEYFYSLCDKHGILVWQDFILSSSGGDAFPSTENEYVNLVLDTSKKAFINRFNHISLVALCGGNELMTSDYVPLDCEYKTLKLLKEAVNELDNEKAFFASSPTGKTIFTDYVNTEKNHDVHGWWKYEGPVKHYTSYNKNNCLLHSEFGADGLMNYYNMDKFLCQQNLKIDDMENNLVWRHHGEWWDTRKRDEALFGRFLDLEQFALCSQFIQGESIRYTVLSHRLRKFQNSGSIVWQFNDNFPNVSCTSLIDYYKSPKIAYYFLKNAYSPLVAALKYEKLFFEKEFKAEIYIANSTDIQSVDLHIEILDVFGNVLLNNKNTYNISKNSSTHIENIELSIPKLEKDVFFVRLTVLKKEHLISSNFYMFSQAQNESEQLFKGLLELKNANISITKNGNIYTVKNNDKLVALFVNPVLENGFAKESFISIFPNESYDFEIINDASEPMAWKQLGR